MPKVHPELSWILIVLAVASLISSFVNLQLGIFLLFFAALAWWVWQHPPGGFYLFIIIAPLLPMLKITQTIATITLLKDIIILTLLLKLIVIPLLTKKLPYRRNPFAMIGILLVGWTVLNVFRADDLLLGILRAREIILYLLLALVLIYLPQTFKFQRQALFWFGLSAIVTIVLSGYQWWWAADSAVLRFDPARAIWIPRISSTLAHPSILGQYLVGVFAFVLALVFSSRKRQRTLALLALAVLLPPIYLTYSRAVWLGLVALFSSMLLAFLWHVVKRRSGRNFIGWVGLTSLFGIFFVALLIMFTPVGVFVRSAFDPTYGSNQERLEFMARLIAPLQPTEALLGRGLGDVTTQNFRSIPLTTFDVASGSARSVQLAKNATLVDNQLLKTFVELGLIGVLITLWLYWLVFRFAWSLAGKKHLSQQVVGFTAVGFVSAYFVQSFFIDIWDIFPTNAFFWIIVALVAKNLDATFGKNQLTIKSNTANLKASPVSADS